MITCFRPSPWCPAITATTPEGVEHITRAITGAWEIQDRAPAGPKLAAEQVTLAHLQGAQQMWPELMPTPATLARCAVLAGRVADWRHAVRLLAVAGEPVAQAVLIDLVDSFGSLHDTPPAVAALGAGLISHWAPVLPGERQRRDIVK